MSYVSLKAYVPQSDADTLVPMHMRAYEDNEIEKLQYPNGEVDAEFVRYLYEKAMIKDESHIAITARASHDILESGNLHAVAKDALVGFAVWTDRSILAAAQATKEEESMVPRGGDPDFGRIWYEQCFHKEEEYTGGTPHIRLLNLTVDPYAQGHKFGGAMLDACVSYARQRRLAVYLEASKAGEPVYTSRGFKRVGEIVLETPLSKSMGRSGTLICMLKEYEE